MSSDMPSDVPKRSATKPILIGCGVVFVVLLLCGGGLAVMGITGWKAFQTTAKQMAQEEQFLRSIVLPGDDAPAEVFAPQSVAGYELTLADDQAAFPALGLEAAGQHAKYERGGEVIEVSVYWMNTAEAIAAFDEVIRRIDDDDRFRSHSHMRLTRSLTFSVDPPALHGRLWYANGWLVFAHSTTVEELQPFQEAYLTAVAAAASETNGAGTEEARSEDGELKSEE